MLNQCNSEECKILLLHCMILLPSGFAFRMNTAQREEKALEAIRCASPMQYGPFFPLIRFLVARGVSVETTVLFLDWKRVG